MSCNFGHDDCQFEDSSKCDMCIDSYHYTAKKIKSRGTFGTSKIKIKDSGRMGASSETKSYNTLEKAINSTIVTGTPNSGAGKVKGDMQIRGIINVMEEMKTTVKKNEGRLPGKETFTIQRAWLDKLEKEAKTESMEIYYLKFSFKEQDDKFYCIVNDEFILDMIVTIKHDREQAKFAQNKIDIAEKRANVVEAENILLRAKLELLEAELKAKNEKELKL